MENRRLISKIRYSPSIIYLPTSLPDRQVSSIINKMNIGIIGIGKVGSIHLRIYKEDKDIKQIYLADTDKNKLSLYNDMPSFSDYRDLIGKVNAVSIATPTFTHFKIAKFFLENNIPTLVEKPLADNANLAHKLIEISKKKKTLLFVGHVERYNNAYIAVKKMIKHPLFIECHRLSLYPNRSLDISVVLDLMIHDLDIVLDLVKDEVKEIQAKGVKILSSNEDIANVRLLFNKGCVANITSSRVSAKRERKIRIFMNKAYISLNYAEQTVEIYQKVKRKIIKKIIPIIREEPLKKEIAKFITSVRNKEFTIDYANQALSALKLACKIEKIIKR